VIIVSVNEQKLSTNKIYLSLQAVFELKAKSGESNSFGLFRQTNAELALCGDVQKSIAVINNQPILAHHQAGGRNGRNIPAYPKIW
jgi:hypothetical protein